MQTNTQSPSFFYQQRRLFLLRKLEEKGGGILLVSNAPRARRNGDCFYPYRPASNFYYLTGFDKPNAFLLLKVNEKEKYKSLLFCEVPSEEEIKWEGKGLAFDEIKKNAGLDGVYPLQSFSQKLHDFLTDFKQDVYLLHDPLSNFSFLDTLKNSIPLQDDEHIFTQAISEMRLVKDDHELELLRTSARIAANAHTRTMIYACTHSQDVYENHLEAELLHEYYTHGARAVAFEPIVAGGEDACVLHYRPSTKKLNSQELCLLDAGCEYKYYASDITRTFPLSGKFSLSQRVVYQLVLDAYKAALASAIPGKMIGEVHAAAVKVLVQGMMDLGLLGKDGNVELEDVLKTYAYRKFYMHGASHWLGLDVHDVSGYGAAYTDGGKESARGTRLLQPGMVLTIEPGLYIRPDESVLPDFWNIGVRIEDTVLITDTGNEILTKGVPLEIEHIEDMLKDSL